MPSINYKDPPPSHQRIEESLAYDESLIIKTRPAINKIPTQPAIKFLAERAFSKTMDHHLKHLANFEGSEGPVLCMVLDGFGIGKGDAGDCVHIAQPTNINRLMKEAKENNLYCELKAHGLVCRMTQTWATAK